jgi:hypothetical protein
MVVLLGHDNPEVGLLRMTSGLFTFLADRKPIRLCLPCAVC